VLVTLCSHLVCSQCLHRKSRYLPGSGHYLTALDSSQVCSFTQTGQLTKEHTGSPPTLATHVHRQHSQAKAAVFNKTVPHARYTRGWHMWKGIGYAAQTSFSTQLCSTTSCTRVQASSTPPFNVGQSCPANTRMNGQKINQRVTTVSLGCSIGNMNLPCTSFCCLRSSSSTAGSCQRGAHGLVLLPVPCLAGPRTVARHTTAATNAAAPRHQAKLCQPGGVAQLGLLQRHGTAMPHRAKPVSRSCCSVGAIPSSMLVLLVEAAAAAAPLLLCVESCPGPAERLLAAAGLAATTASIANIS
jgi:hypothetical protein